MIRGLYTMVGMRFRNAEKFVQSLPAGEPLTLIRDPNNAHDPHAVQVHAREQFVAFIKGTEVAKLAAVMDAGTKVTAKLAWGPRWPMVETEEGI